MIKEKIRVLLVNSEVNLDEDVLDYGLNVFITYLKYLTLIIPFSILLGEFFEVLIFIILFIPLRRYIGGFHFNNLTYCFIGSVALAILLPYIAINISIPFTLVLIIVIATILLTVYIGAVDHYNKPLTTAEKSKHTKIALFIELILIAILAIAYLFDFKYLCNIITLIFFFCIVSINISKLHR